MVFAFALYEICGPGALVCAIVMSQGSRGRYVFSGRNSDQLRQFQWAGIV